MSNILVVCTANRCRSPIGEALLNRSLQAIGKGHSVSSAGFLPAGSPAEPQVIEVLSEVGLDATAHRSRVMSPYLTDDADLILTMERAHVRELAVNFGSFAKSFTVKEFVRRAESNLPSGDEAFSQWVARLHLGRKASDLMGANGADDIADPIGKPVAAFVHTRDELESLLARIARTLP